MTVYNDYNNIFIQNFSSDLQHLGRQSEHWVISHAQQLADNS